MEDKYKKFLEFNWTNSAEWQLYYSNLFPTPAGTKIIHFKKKFYKLKVDEAFDTTWSPPEVESAPTNTTNASQSQYRNTFAGTPPNSPVGPAIKILWYIESLLFLIFLVTIFYQYHTLKIISLALLIRVFRRVGVPKFTMEYAQLIFLDEHFQLVLYSILFMIDRINFFTLVPLAITAILNISEFCKSQKNIFKIVMPYVEKISNKRVELALMRANTEVAIGFLLFVGIFFGINSFILPIFYWQYLRFKYIVNEDTKVAFRKLNDLITILKNKPMVPSPIKYGINKIQEFGSYMGRSEPAQGQAAGGSNCTIF